MEIDLFDVCLDWPKPLETFASCALRVAAAAVSEGAIGAKLPFELPLWSQMASQMDAMGARAREINGRKLEFGTSAIWQRLSRSANGHQY